ncbi:MAG: hypothetical protein ABL866_15905 [Devosia sp.]
MSGPSFRTNDISAERYEIVLVSRRFPPSLRLAVTSVIVGVILPTGSWLLTGVDSETVALRALAIAGFGVPVFYALFYWKTGQLTGNSLLANITYIRGHVEWSDSLRYMLKDVTQLSWSEVTKAQIIPRPGLFAQHRTALALGLRDGTQLKLSVPNLRPSEEVLLAEALGAITARNGIRFSNAAAT